MVTELDRLNRLLMEHIHENEILNEKIFDLNKFKFYFDNYHYFKIEILIIINLNLDKTKCII